MHADQSSADRYKTLIDYIMQTANEIAEKSRGQNFMMLNPVMNDWANRYLAMKENGPLLYGEIMLLRNSAGAWADLFHSHVHTCEDVVIELYPNNTGSKFIMKMFDMYLEVMWVTFDRDNPANGKVFAGYIEHKPHIEEIFTLTEELLEAPIPPELWQQLEEMHG